jgi:hypothetical protein
MITSEPISREEVPTGTWPAERVRRLLRQCRGARVRIEDDLLYELVTYGDGLLTRAGLGNWCQGECLPKAVLTYLSMRAFDIHRLPWHHDQTFSAVPVDARTDEAMRLLADEARVERACSELRRLHEHTVNTLLSCGVERVTLRRGLTDSEDRPQMEGHCTGYATRVATMAEIAQRLGQSHFRLPVNVLSSWSGGGYSHLSVVIEHTFAVEDVAWCDAVLAPADPSDRERAAFEGGEWIVLNRAPTGLIHLSSTCVVKKSVKLPDMSRWDVDQLRQQLLEHERTYGTLSSMFRDLHRYPAQLRWRERVRRAWALLREPYA